MAASRSASDDDQVARLERCIRDLSALNALPSMCIGGTPDQILEIVFDALPVALSCELAYLRLPGAPVRERGVLRGRQLDPSQLDAVRSANVDSGGACTLALAGSRDLHCMVTSVPVGAGEGLLVIGRHAPLDAVTDRVLIRSAANLIGTTFESAIVLEAARQRDEFLAMLGHELRNPLAPIIAAVELLRVRGLPEIERERAIIERQARHLVRLVDDLLDVSRAVSGKIVLAKQRVELSEVIATAVEQSRALIDERRHQLEVRVPRDGLVVEADPARLAQTISNLLTNAAKYTDPGGTISLTAERLNDHVKIKVADNGIGIEPEMLGSIFDLFVQEREASEHVRGGLGVGLSIVRSLISLHGGSVTAASAGRGRGAEFTIDLALGTASGRAAAQASPGDAAEVGRRAMRILIVDDNRDAAEMLGEWLETRGDTVALAHDGAAAIAEAVAFAPDIVVLDIGLPVMDGYEVARQIRETERGRSVRLIALTGYGRPTDQRRALEASFDAFLVKPIGMTRLEDTIRSLS